MLKQYFLRIADISIALQTDIPLPENPQFLPFLTESENPDIRAVFRRVEQLPSFSEEILHEDYCYRVHPDGVRTFFDAPRDLTPYAVAKWEDGANLRIDYLEKGSHCVSQMSNAFFHLGFENILLRHNRLCLHAACVDTPLGGILFSGQSGIGKSTQAELWQRYRAAKQINGDRPILSQTGDGWLAWGSPYAGSSRCHVNESCPVRAIVMLKQAKSCALRQLNPGDAFRAVWSGLTMPSWDEDCVTRGLTLTTALLETVPVYEFACTPDEQAVECLERGLQG